MTLKQKTHEILFEADTNLGKIFDVSLLVMIVFSILIVMLESVKSYSESYQIYFDGLEWFITFLFTVEYGLRIYTVEKPLKYITSFYGIVDLLSILPSYLSLFLIGSESLLILRSLRLLRIFRVFKLGRYLGEGQILVRALIASREKITVFLVGVLAIVLVIGSVMYIVEGKANSGFDSIPRSVYWAIVTITTVGYGDISPITPFGQFLSAILMILGYGVLAVPTGIVSLELSQAQKEAEVSTRACPSCSHEGHDYDALHCKYCGEKLYGC